MSAEKRPTSFSGGGSTRFGDTPLAFGLHRYTCASGGSFSEKPPLWRFSVSKYIGRDVLIEVDITPSMLREMSRFLESAVETVRTDGGRATAEQES